MIGMDHPFRPAAMTQHGEIRIGVDHLGFQHLAREGDGARHILDQKPHLEAAQRPAVILRRHPGFPIAAFLRHELPLSFNHRQQTSGIPS
jgi:hypothetical protein